MQYLTNQIPTGVTGSGPAIPGLRGEWIDADVPAVGLSRNGLVTVETPLSRHAGSGGGVRALLVRLKAGGIAPAELLAAQPVVQRQFPLVDLLASRREHRLP